MAAGDDKGAAAACPVDHHRPRDACPVDHSSNISKKSPESCPVDHKSREVWLSQARAAAATTAAPNPASNPPAKSPSPSSSSSSSSSSWNPLTWRVPFFSSSGAATAAAAAAAAQNTQPPSPPKRASILDEGRVVSSIPRAIPSSSSSSSSSKTPSNHENESGADAETGNWVYPSEKMFFDALRRKGNAGGAHPADMRTVVPIHNAVNERAWREIKAWEAPYRCRHGRGRGGEEGDDDDDKNSKNNKDGCAAGPRLESFSGLAANLSPRARLNTWLGYTAPFDRHDWVVDRCGVRVEYVIDFYAGRPPAASAAAPADASHKLNFYLDVRPKLNTWEGVKMRVLRALGVV